MDRSAPTHHVTPEIASSPTLPGQVYGDAELFEHWKRAIFARSWQWIGTRAEAPKPGHARPFLLLPGLLDEPLVLSRDDSGELWVFSNVCTHRAKLVLEEEGPTRTLVCRYHGRSFEADGRCRAAPGFEKVSDVPGPDDNLPRVALGELFGHLFVSLDPEVPFEVWAQPLRERFAFLDIDTYRREAARDREYTLPAHWALYVDNYLEGFHIPTVHPELARSVESESYRNELFPHGTLQTGFATADETLAFEHPEASADPSLRVAGFYAWLFPNTMFNVYPWGLSLNVVQPIDLRRTRIVYRGYVGRPELTEGGAGGALDLVEAQDQAVVASVQQGVGASLYRSGRFAPGPEVGVHHFHRRLASYTKR